MIKALPPQLTLVAKMLGWPGLRLHQHADTTWYESGESKGGRNDFFLQFNHSQNQENSYLGAVYALRFRICTGWHPFTLGGGVELEAETARLSGWLHRKWFSTLAMRRKFRELHPECQGYSWKRIRDEGPPYPQA